MCLTHSTEKEEEILSRVQELQKVRLLCTGEHEHCAGTANQMRVMCHIDFMGGKKKKK